MTCKACRQDVKTPSFTMAFQPIVDLSSGEIFAYESLVRPVDAEGRPTGGGAADVLAQIDDENRYAFDQACRVKAITLAAKLALPSLLSINFLPNAVYQPAACLRRTFEAATASGFPATRIIFEVTEAEPSRDPAHLRAIFAEYKSRGLITAIDDFGAGHSGLNLLADFQPDIVKLDMNLTRGVDTDRTRQSIVRALSSMCRDLGISIVAEGIETAAEARCLTDLGLRLFQGYLFARPAIEALPRIEERVLENVGMTMEVRRPLFAAR